MTENFRPVWKPLAFGVLQIFGYAFGLTALLYVTFIFLRVPPVESLRALWVGAFGDSESGHWYAISETLVKTTPLLLTGLGVVTAWRAGLFSIGGEGQLMVGASAAALVARLLPNVPGSLLTILMIAAAVTAGAIWGGIAGWLRVRRNVPEVISTIMLNYIALYLLGWLVNGPLQERAHRLPQSEPLPDAALLARILPPSLSNGMTTRLHSGVILALLVTVGVAIYLFFTSSGFSLRVIGQNADAARTARLPVDKLRIQAMLISGGLCGLAGVVELLGVSGRLYADFSPGWGYTAIPVALLGGLNPGGTLLSALFFGALSAGSSNLSRFSNVSSVLIYIVQAAAALAIVGARAWRSRKKGNDE